MVRYLNIKIVSNSNFYLLVLFYFIIQTSNSKTKNEKEIRRQFAIDGFCIYVRGMHELIHWPRVVHKVFTKFHEWLYSFFRMNGCDMLLYISKLMIEMKIYTRNFSGGNRVNRMISPNPPCAIWNKTFICSIHTSFHVIATMSFIDPPLSTKEYFIFWP